MFTFTIERFVPDFILADKNGYAIAKAIEAGIELVNEIVYNGVCQITDTEKMAEWRLDELAWEYNIPYNYTADIEIKRKWISEAYEISRIWGTPESIVKYMEAYFDSSTLEESTDYGGDPYHFRMLFPDVWTQEKIDWATSVIDKIKSLRSVLDKYQFIASWRQQLLVQFGIYGLESGTYFVSKEDVPDLNCYTDEDGNILLDERRYPLIAEE